MLISKIYRFFVEILFLSLIRNVDGKVGERLRFKYYKSRFKYLGENVVFDTNVYIYGAEYISIGDHTHIDKYVILHASSTDLDLSGRILKEKKDQYPEVIKGELIIGKNCHISQYCMIFAHFGVKIGDLCTLSTGSKIYSLSSMPNNPFDPSEIISIQPYSGKSPSIAGAVVLENNTWLGVNVLVGPGIRIGKNSFVRTNSVVMNTFGENSYLGGDPAKRIKNRYNYNF